MELPVMLKTATNAMEVWIQVQMEEIYYQT